jgi:hypothetical protein
MSVTNVFTSECLFMVGGLIVTLLVLLSAMHTPALWKNEERRFLTFYLMITLIMPITNTLMLLLQYQFSISLSDPYKSILAAGLLTGAIGVTVNAAIELAKRRFSFVTILIIPLLVGFMAVQHI